MQFRHADMPLRWVGRIDARTSFDARGTPGAVLAMAPPVEENRAMAMRLLTSLLLVGLCAGCTTFQRPPSDVPVSWHEPGLVITHPNGNGPQVVRWGPPAYDCCTYPG
jgi:hypothetical protein